MKPLPILKVKEVKKNYWEMSYPTVGPFDKYYQYCDEDRQWERTQLIMNYNSYRIIRDKLIELAENNPHAELIKDECFKELGNWLIQNFPEMYPKENKEN